MVNHHSRSTDQLMFVEVLLPNRVASAGVRLPISTLDRGTGAILHSAQ